MRYTATLAVALTLVSLTPLAPARGQTTNPAGDISGATTRPAGKSAEEMLDQLLRSTDETPKPVSPTTKAQGGGVDVTSGVNAVAPGAPLVTVMREGTDIVNRTGRLTRSADGQGWEFTFESDGRAMLDPPVIILPNLHLMKMESAVAGNSRDLRFRVTGEVTEYRGRNYVLLRKSIPVSDAEKQF